jgi:hypothetical protein
MTEYGIQSVSSTDKIIVFAYETVSEEIVGWKETCIPGIEENLMS